MNKARIDVHHHVLPEFYKDVQRKAGITGTAYQSFPQWSPESSLKLMDDHGIATAILSFTSPGIFFGDVGQTRELAVQFNDYLASLMRQDAQRFGGFAMLPLPDVDAAVKEIGRVQDELKLDGICLLTSVDERYIGHPDFEPVYAELDRRRCVVFILVLPHSAMRSTKRVLIGSFAAASVRASFATWVVTPSISKITRPGLTRATQYSGAPLPEPIRTSAGFFDTGTSG